MRRIHFLTGLPRTGSTLLTSLLNQHDDIYASATSPLPTFVETLRNIYGESPMVRAQPEEATKIRIKEGIKGLLTGWAYPTNDVPDNYIDKSRAWIGLYPLINSLLYEPKMIVTVRDLRSIYASMEKLYRENVYNKDPVELLGDYATVEDRVRNWSVNVPVGHSISALNTAIQTKTVDNMLIIRYEDLIADTQGSLNSIYKFIGVEPLDFTLPIENITPEDDRAHGIPGLHTVYEEIKSSEEDYEGVLGKELSDRIFDDYTWYNEALGYVK